MNEKLTEFIISINTRLASIDAKLDTVQSQLKDHSERIRRLESVEPRVRSGDDFKADMLKLLAKGLVVSVLVIASLTGAGGILQQMFKQSGL